MQRTINDSNTIWIGVTVIVIVFSAFILVSWKIGLFDFKGTDASAKIVSASIALVGALFGSLISIIGLLLKHSLEQRSTEIKEQAERRLLIDSQRNSALATEAEDRLTLDTAIRAVELLSTSNGNLAPMIQRVGALFALTSLKRYELATALTMELLVKNEIDSFSAASILSRVMESGETVLQERAVNIYYSNLERFLTPDGSMEIPNQLFNWEKDLSEYSRVWGFEAIAQLLSLRLLMDWKITQAYALLAVLGLAWISEPEGNIKLSMGTVLNKILPAFSGIDVLYHPLKTIDIKSIRAEVASAPETSHHYPKLIADLENWVLAANDHFVEQDLKPNGDSNKRNDC